MDYETMDWEAEAKRVAAAFGYDGECEFVESEIWMSLSKLRDGSDLVQFPVIGDLELAGQYSSEYLCFYLKKLSIDISGVEYTDVVFSWDERFCRSSVSLVSSMLMARALFHLDLLTPEVEVALQVSISAHQKLEWTLEYEARLKATES